MQPNPAQDILVFLTKPAWPTGLFWLLLLGSVAVAIVVAARQPSLRTRGDMALWLLAASSA